MDKWPPLLRSVIDGVNRHHLQFSTYFRNVFEIPGAKLVQEYFSLEELSLLCKFLDSAFEAVGETLSASVDAPSIRTAGSELAAHVLLLLRVLFILSKHPASRKLLCETSAYSHVANIALDAAATMTEEDWANAKPFSEVCNGNIFNSCCEVFTFIFSPSLTWFKFHPYNANVVYKPKIDAIFSVLSFTMAQAASAPRSEILKRVDSICCVFNAWLRCEGAVYFRC